MQTVGTLRGTRAIYLLLFLIPLISYAYAFPLQFLPSIPGYVPVYIRHGDEPLVDVNPDLAEAFRETVKSVKSLQLDHTLAHMPDSFKDDEINELSEKHPNPLQVREAESRSFANTKGDESESKDSNKPKLLNIYGLPDDNERKHSRRHRVGNRRKISKQPVLKVSPISDAEKEELKKLAIEIEKEETKPNDFYVPNPKHETDNLAGSIKLQNPLDESSKNLPEIQQYIDSLKILKIAASEANEDKEEKTKEEPLIKKQRPSTILSNVHKISPIVLPNEDETSDDNKTKDFTDPNDEIAID